MINQTLIWLLMLPPVLAIIIYAVRRRSYPDSWMPCLIFGFVGLLLVSLLFFASKGTQTSDVEIWNGKVVSKERNHGTYEESYECNCRNVTETYTETQYYTDSKGKSQSRTVTKTRTKKVCQTCYRTHYTVKWECNTTVGSYTIDSEDSLSSLVYNTKDPARYTSIKVGDPAAKRSSYTNYIQAVPNSLFAPAPSDLKAKFTGLIPPYPDQVFDFYRINRFVTPGWAPADAAQWNQDISLALRDIGPKKQVNLIIVVAKTNDSNYEYALRDAWEGANKNDVVLIIGSMQYPKIDFVRVLSWTKNETFKVELRDAVEAKGSIDRSLVQLTSAQIEKNFERRHMREFAYLEGEIDPPDWMIYLILALVCGGGFAIFWFIPDLVDGGFRRRAYR